MSMLSKAFHKGERFVSQVSGHHAASQATKLAKQSLDDARQQKAEFDAERTKIEAEKKAQQGRINEKSVRSARASLRRPGFLDSSIEGTSDVLG